MFADIQRPWEARRVVMIRLDLRVIMSISAWVTLDDIPLIGPGAVTGP